MAGITLAQAESQLALWLDADAALSSGKTFSLDGRTITYAETQERIQYWQRMCVRLSRTLGRSVTAHRVIIQDG